MYNIETYYKEFLVCKFKLHIAVKNIPFMFALKRFSKIL